MQVKASSQPTLSCHPSPLITQASLEICAPLPWREKQKERHALYNFGATCNFPVARCPSPLAVVAQSLSLLLKTFILSLCLRVWECGASGCVLHLLFLFSNAHSSPHIIHHGSIQRCLARHERCFKRQRPRRVEASQQAIQNRTTKDHRQKEKARSQSPSTKSDTSLIAGHDTNLSSRRHTVRNSRPRGTRSSHWAHLTSPNYVKNSQGSVDFRSTSSTSVLSQAQPSLIPDSNTTDT